MQVRDFTTRKDYGCLVTNPPYGERLGEREEVAQMYRDLGMAMKPYDTWSVYVITSNENFEEYYGRSATKKRKLYNGDLKTDYYQYFGKRPPRQHQG